MRILTTPFLRLTFGLATAVLIAEVVSHPTAQAQPTFGAWTNLYSGDGNYADEATAIAVDGNGNVLVTGYSDGGLSTGTLDDYATIKYSNAGIPLWTNRYNGPANSEDYARAMVVDTNGNVFVTGYSASTNAPNFKYAYATIAYSSVGLPLWTNRYKGPVNGNDYARAIAVDASGNVIVTGSSFDFHDSRFNFDFVTIKYSKAGEPLWTNRYNGPGNGWDEAKAVAVDTSGNVFVTGYSHGTNGYSDYVTIKYSGAAGVPLWTNLYHGPTISYDQANAMTVDDNGNVFVTGWSYGPNGYDYATIAYSSSGLPLWTNHYNGPANGNDRACAIAVDGSGNVMVTGGSQGSGSSLDFATIKYSGSGVASWTNRFKGTGGYSDEGLAVAVDRSGNVFVTGYSRGTGSYCTTIKYSATGVPLWTIRYTKWMGHGNAVAVDNIGNAFVTGKASNGPNSDYLTIKYPNLPPSLAITRTATNTVAIWWPSPAADFLLQQNVNVAGTNWTEVSLTPTDDGTNKTVVVDLREGERFYRLFHP